MVQKYDVAIIGGGHNGLVAAAYLARSGLKPVVLEAREVVGGAAVSEHPFGPDYTVTMLSYVVSLLPPRLVQELQLERHGYRVFPQGPYFAPRRDGRALQMPRDLAERREQIKQFSARDADAVDDWDAWLDDLAAVLTPLLTQIPPRLGSHRAGDLVRLMTMSIADLVEERFESDAVRGALSVSGVIGTWAGPRSAGTAYVMAHHHVGDLGGDGQASMWGFPRGGMGGVTRALAESARSFGAEIRTGARVARIDHRGEPPRVTGVTLDSGEEVAAPVVVTTAHPAISFLRLVDASVLPGEFLDDIRRWKTRSGTVKINCAVDRLPRFTSRPYPDPDVYGGTIVLAESLDDVEGAFQDAVAGRTARQPFADICIPSVLDDSLAPPGHHVVSMFTQWVPYTWNEQPHTTELDAYADRVFARLDDVAPGFADSVVDRVVIGPHRMEHEYGLVGGNIFHGELTPAQLFHARPAAGYSDLRTPLAGLYQAGSATHGGGGVTGIPGRNVVRQILRDRRTSRWLRRPS